MIKSRQFIVFQIGILIMNFIGQSLCPSPKMKMSPVAKHFDWEKKARDKIERIVKILKSKAVRVEEIISEHSFDETIIMFDASAISDQLRNLNEEIGHMEKFLQATGQLNPECETAYLYAEMIGRTGKLDEFQEKFQTIVSTLAYLELPLLNKNSEKMNQEINKLRHTFEGFSVCPVNVNDHSPESLEKIFLALFIRYHTIFQLITAINNQLKVFIILHDITEGMMKMLEYGKNCQRTEKENLMTAMQEVLPRGNDELMNTFISIFTTIDQNLDLDGLLESLKSFPDLDKKLKNIINILCNHEFEHEDPCIKVLEQVTLLVENLKKQQKIFN